MKLTKRQLQILRRLAREGDLDEATLRCTLRSMESMWLNGLVVGYFKKYGSTRDDRYWQITKTGRVAAAPDDVLKK